MLFILASFALIIIPGPNTLYVMTRGITQGRKAAFISALGASSGDLLYAIFTALGLVIILHQSATIYGMIKTCGALYLIYIGIRTIFSKKGMVGESRKVKEDTGGKLYIMGFLTAALNPKTAIFFASFLPQFVDANNEYAAFTMFVHGLIFFSIGLLVLSIYAQTSSFLGQWIVKRQKVEQVFKWLSGSIFCGLGIRMILAEHR